MLLVIAASVIARFWAFSLPQARSWKTTVLTATGRLRHVPR
jgi:hypothetical protein